MDRHAPTPQVAMGILGEISKNRFEWKMPFALLCKSGHDVKILRR